MLGPGLRLAAALLALTYSCTAAAQSKSALSWVREPGAESCIGSVELGQRVERLVGPMLVPASQGEVSVEGRIARQPRGFVADVVIADAAGKILGTRQLKSEADDCHAIDEKLAFVIAVAIDPNAALAELPAELASEEDPGAALLAELRAQPPGPAAVPAKPSTPPARTRARPSAQPTDPGSPPFGVRMALEPALGLGNLPSASAGASLGVGVAFYDLALWLRAVGWWPQTQVARGPSKVQVGLLGLSAAVCPLTLRAERWTASLCAGVGVERLHAKPLGFDGTVETPWIVGPDLELRAGRELGSHWWLGLSAMLQSRWPRRDVGYEVDDTPETVYRTPLAGGRLAAALELRF